MPCYHPLRAVLVISAGGVRRLSFSRSAVGKGLSLPCGRCIGCRLERARQWAVRIMHESKMHEENCFITLTYDEKNVPKGRTLVVEDCQLFLKRLRERIAPTRVRFFLAGEYGEKLGRPHYHAIIFGYSFPDRVKLQSVGQHAEFSSELLDETWGKGICHIGSVTFDSACYVANYATKKITGKGAGDHYAGRKPEFVLMSRGGRKAGGIGRGWIKEFKTDVYPSDEIIVRGVPGKPPRYYDKFYQAGAPQDFEAIKVSREARALEAQEAEDKIDGPMSLKRATALYDSGTYGGDKRMMRLRVREAVATAKAALKKGRLENK